MTCQIPYLLQSVAPVTEPLTLAEVKEYLRVTNTEEDTYITSLIGVAREAAEWFVRKSLITQSWMLSYDDYSPTEVILPRGPVQSVDEVKIVSRSGIETIVDSTTYYLNAGKETLVFDATPVGHIVQIYYTAGYGNSASSVPKDIRQGMLIHIAQLYEKRGEDNSLTSESIRLYKPFKVIKL